MRGKMKSDIRRLTATTIKSGRTANAIGGTAWPLIAVDDLGRIECAGCRCALAHDLVAWPRP